jgi:hypothetical protein
MTILITTSYTLNNRRDKMSKQEKIPTEEELKEMASTAYWKNAGTFPDGSYMVSFIMGYFAAAHDLNKLEKKPHETKAPL